MEKIIFCTRQHAILIDRRQTFSMILMIANLFEF